MKHLLKKLNFAAFAVCTVAAAGNLWAGGSTATINVTATVVGACKFNTSSPTLSIGTLDFDRNGLSRGKSFAQGSDLTVTYWCTKGTVYDLRDSVGTIKRTAVARDRKLTNGIDSIPYTLRISDAGAEAGRGTPLSNITLSAQVAPGSYDRAMPGAYTDTLTLTVTP